MQTHLCCARQRSKGIVNLKTFIFQADFEQDESGMGGGARESLSYRGALCGAIRWRRPFITCGLLPECMSRIC